MKLEIHPLTGIGRIVQGDDIATALLPALDDLDPRSGDILVVTHKIVSKAEGAIRVVTGDEEEFKLALVTEIARSIVRRRGPLIIAETKHGFVCANAGVDRSNAEEGTMILLPDDPDRSAHRIRLRLSQAIGVDMPVIISDTFGRPWRRGLTDVAIGVSGLEPILDLRGTRDWSGRELDVTEVAVADEIAAAADLVMGKASGIPAALVRGFEGSRGEGKASELIRPVEEDLFR
ncbi:MAG TPA: coenzyme F420-0:L-glutamate ligase [Acidimicrobiia bacterium]|nr:coenzyme F420-0:L-glutamate ligase [Acidimicrobiia bacterium]